MKEILELTILLIMMYFPLLVYSYYAAYKKDIKEKERTMLLNLALFSTLYITITLLKYFDNPIYTLTLSIPLFFAYSFRNKPMVIFDSLIIISFLYKFLSPSVLPIIFIILTIYYIVFLYYIRTNDNKFWLTIIYSCLTYVSSVIICYILGVFNILEYSLFSLFYIPLLFYSTKLIEKAREIINLHMSLKEIQHEKQIKSSLFKITHEIKNPLAVCKGYLDMFDSRDETKTEKYFGIIKQEIERTLNLLNDFKDFTKINISKQKVDMNELLDDVKDTLYPLAKKYNVIYNIKTEDDLEVLIDYNRIKQVIINLVKNAIEASEKQGKVTIKSYAEDKNIYLIISDSGVGMSKENLDKLSLPFYTTKTNGSGLGVCLSKEIIDAHNGNLRYTSVLGKGTTVRVTLPIT